MKHRKLTTSAVLAGLLVSSAFLAQVAQADEDANNSQPKETVEASNPSQPTADGAAPAPVVPSATTPATEQPAASTPESAEVAKLKADVADLDKQVSDTETAQKAATTDTETAKKELDDQKASNDQAQAEIDKLNQQVTDLQKQDQEASTPSYKDYLEYLKKNNNKLPSTTEAAIKYYDLGSSNSDKRVALSNAEGNAGNINEAIKAVDVARGVNDLRKEAGLKELYVDPYLSTWMGARTMYSSWTKDHSKSVGIFNWIKANAVNKYAENLAYNDTAYNAASIWQAEKANYLELAAANGLSTNVNDFTIDFIKAANKLKLPGSKKEVGHYLNQMSPDFNVIAVGRTDIANPVTNSTSGASFFYSKNLDEELSDGRIMTVDDYEKSLKDFAAQFQAEQPNQEKIVALQAQIKDFQNRIKDLADLTKKLDDAQTKENELAGQLQELRQKREQAQAALTKAEADANAAEPAEPTKPDTGTADKPSEPAKPDAGTTDKPAEPAKPDAGNTDKPSEPSKPDTGTTDKPSEPTKPDAGTTDKPAEPSVSYIDVDGYKVKVITQPDGKVSYKRETNDGKTIDVDTFVYSPESIKELYDQAVLDTQAAKGYVAKNPSLTAEQKEEAYKTIDKELADYTDSIHKRHIKTMDYWMLWREDNYKIYRNYGYDNKVKSRNEEAIASLPTLSQELAAVKANATLSSANKLTYQEELIDYYARSRSGFGFKYDNVVYNAAVGGLDFNKLDIHDLFDQENAWWLANSTWFVDYAVATYKSELAAIGDKYAKDQAEGKTLTYTRPVHNQEVTLRFITSEVTDEKDENGSSKIKETSIAPDQSVTLDIDDVTDILNHAKLIDNYRLDNSTGVLPYDVKDNVITYRYRPLKDDTIDYTSVTPPKLDVLVKAVDEGNKEIISKTVPLQLTYNDITLRPKSARLIWEGIYIQPVGEYRKYYDESDHKEKWGYAKSWLDYRVAPGYFDMPLQLVHDGKVYYRIGLKANYTTEGTYGEENYKSTFDNITYKYILVGNESDLPKAEVEPAKPDAGTTDKPAEPAKPSTGESDKPVEPAKPDAGNTDKPSEPSKPDTGTTDKPTEPAKPDTGTTDKPVEPTKPDTGTTDKPSELSKPDAGTTDKPVEPSKPDAGTTDKPVEPAKPDTGTTDKPVEPSKPDAGNTNKPVEPAKPDTGTTDKPSEPTKPSTGDTTKPVEPTTPTDNGNTTAPVTPTRPTDTNGSGNSTTTPTVPVDATRSLTDPVTGVAISGKGDALAGVVRANILVTATNVFGGQAYNAYEITLLNQNMQAVQPKGYVTVTLPTNGLTVDQVYYITRDNRLEALPFALTNGGVSFDTNHFSTYAVTYQAGQQLPTTDTVHSQADFTTHTASTEAGTPGVHGLSTTAPAAAQATPSRVAANSAQLPNTGEKENRAGFLAGILLFFSSLFFISKRRKEDK